MLRNALLASTLSLVLLVASLAQAADSKPARQPNFVVILADDLGAPELGCYGNAKHRTPNLDRLAQTGVRFRTCWATPVCSPTRVEIMTGRYAFRTGWYDFIGRGTTSNKDHLGPEEVTFAHMLKKAGYATGLAGKWQLGFIQRHPRTVFDSGFDEYFTWAWRQLPADAKFAGSPRQRYWHPAIIENGKHFPTTPEQYGPDLYCDWLIDFMKRHKDQPFLAYYPMCLTQKPYDPTPDPEHPGRKTEGNLKTNVEYMDHLVGRIVKALDEMGLRDDTIIFFAGDNGTGGAGKNTATEMGVRVSMIANSPKRIATGLTSDAMIDFSDVLPTLADLAGASLPEGVTIDGRSFAHVLQGKPGPTRDWVFSYLGHRRLIRDKRWLLDGYGSFYDCGQSRAGRGYKDVTRSDAPEVLAARKRLETIIKDMPAPPEPKEEKNPKKKK